MKVEPIQTFTNPADIAAALHEHGIADKFAAAACRLVDAVQGSQPDPNLVLEVYERQVKPIAERLESKEKAA